MEEKRIYKRTALDTEVELSLVNGEGNSLKLQAEIVNVSKDGVGFLAKEQLMIGAIYQARIRLWTGQKIDIILKVVRAKDEGDGSYSYGCIFVGMAGNEAVRILIYQMFNEKPEA